MPSFFSRDACESIRLFGSCVSGHSVTEEYVAWIESHQSLRKHPKLARLCDELKITPFSAIGHLHVFWWWCIDYAPNGQLEKYNALQLADGAEWHGDPVIFVEALINAHFLDQSPTGLMVHDWLDFCGELVKQRCRRLKEKRRKMRHVVPSNPRHPTGPDRTGPNQPNQPYQPDGFARAWARYPKKKSKGQAEKTWAKLHPDEQLQNRIRDAIERAMTSEQWVEDGGKYIPHFSTWLRAKGWEDEIKTITCEHGIRKHPDDRFYTPCGQPVSPEQAGKSKPICNACLAVLRQHRQTLYPAASPGDVDEE